MYKVKLMYVPFLFIIDVIGHVLFWWIKLSYFKTPKKILCIRAENIGDVVLATPAFRALKKRFPDADVDVLVRSFTKDVLVGNKYVSNIVDFDLPWLGLEGKKASWLQTLSFIRRLRRERYDVVIDFHGDPRNILLSFLVGRYCVGFGVRGLGFLLNKVVSFNDDQQQIQINLDIVRYFGADADTSLDFVISKKDLVYADNLLKKVNKANFVVISPSAGRKDKLWVNKNWSELCNKLISDYSCYVVFTGVSNDGDIVKSIISGVKNQAKVVDLSGKTSIKQLGAVIKYARLVICPDSGASHIARALNTKLIALFSKEDPKRWGYSDDEFRYIKKDDIKNIAVSDVLKVVKDMGVWK